MRDKNSQAFYRKCPFGAVFVSSSFVLQRCAARRVTYLSYFFVASMSINNISRLFSGGGVADIGKAII